ncbi:TPA: toprim domain-containing protein [Bacillus cereus]|nr:toprim domain-containing protein [Bacillus cereus]
MTRSEVITYSYQNVEEALAAVNAQDQGRYFLCTCPECNQPEAFIYKNNPQFLQCNRENVCGSSIVFEYEENKKVNDWKGKQDIKDPEITPEQRKEIDLVTKLLKHIQYNTENKNLESFRGMSRNTTQDFILDLEQEKLVKKMFEIAPNIFYSKKTMQNEGKKINYASIPDMVKRNIVLPIYGDDGMIDRILLRSTIDPNLAKKEIQLQVNPKSNAKDYFKDIPKKATHIVIGESPIDAYSFREIDSGVGIYALTGSRKWRKVIEDIKSNKDALQDKVFIIATDNDKAGIEANENIKKALEEENLNYRSFKYQLEDIKDTNEYLQKNKQGFQQSYEAIKHNMWDKNLIDAPKLEQRLVINRLYRSDQKSIDRTQFKVSYEGLTLHNIAIDNPPGSVNIPGLEANKLLVEVDKRMEGFLKHIAQKAPKNQDYQDIVIPTKNSKPAQLKILSYKKENDMTRKVSFQIGEIIVRDAEVNSLPGGEDPMVFYPRHSNRTTLVTGTEEFNENLIKIVKQYEKNMDKQPIVKQRSNESTLGR